MVKDVARRREAKRAFQKLWVAGTLGAFFTAFVRTFPVHFGQRAGLKDADILYTLDLANRYSFLAWLLTYFFVSNLENELSKEAAPKRWEITYDVVQSFGGLTAAYYLGFIIPVEVTPLCAYAVASGAILGICVLSLIWFRKGQPCKVNSARLVGAVLSLMALVIAFAMSYSILSLLVILMVQLALWVVLAVFVNLRLDTPGSP